jgi:hypothetical protein
LVLWGLQRLADWVAWGESVLLRAEPVVLPAARRGGQRPLAEGEAGPELSPCVAQGAALPGLPQLRVVRPELALVVQRRVPRRALRQHPVLQRALPALPLQRGAGRW